MLTYHLSSLHAMSFMVPTHYVHQFFGDDSGPSKPNVQKHRYPGIIRDKDHALIFLKEDSGVRVDPRGYITEFALCKGRPRWRHRYFIQGYSTPLGLRAILLENIGMFSFKQDHTIDVFVHSAWDEDEEKYRLTILPPTTLVISLPDDRSQAYHFREIRYAGDEKYSLFCTEDAVIRVRNVRSLYWFLHRGLLTTFYRDLRLAMLDTIIINTANLSLGQLKIDEDIFRFPSELNLAEPWVELSWTLLPVFDFTRTLAKPLQFVLLARKPRGSFLLSECLAYTFTFTPGKDDES